MAGLGERGYRIKADPTKQGWEDSEFPILCETCLGDNPYVRMTREPFGGACHVCERPYTIFRWKPGPKARFKVVVICQMCSKIKHVCQCCMLDLQYGLPVEVRDRVLAEAAAKTPGGHSLALTQTASAPSSDVNRQYAINQAEQAMQSGSVVPYSAAAGAAPEAHEALMRLGRHQAYYQRNAPKLCSFFARGECSRGLECPYRHEMPRDKGDPLAKQNYRDRYYGNEDPVAAKLLVRMAEKSERSIESMPENDDPSAVTVWIGGITEGSVKEDQLRAAFSPHGEVKKVFLAGKQECGFVEFSTHAEAIAALKALRGGRLAIGGKVLRINWAHKTQDGSLTEGGTVGGLSGPTSHLYGAAADPSAGAPRAAEAQAAAAASGPPGSGQAAAAAAGAAPVAVAPWAFMAAAAAAAAAASGGSGGAPPAPFPGAGMPGWPPMMMMPPWPGAMQMGGSLTGGPPFGVPAPPPGYGRVGPPVPRGHDARDARQREGQPYAAAYPSMDPRQAGGRV